MPMLGLLGAGSSRSFGRISKLGAGFRYRSIYTRGYVHCGYQNSSPWRNTNRKVFSTDTITNLGDMMDNSASYIDGGFNDYNSFVFNCSGAVQGSSSVVSSMSMYTETLRTRQTSWDMKVSRTNNKSLMNPMLTAIYITGGGSATTDKFNCVTDTMMAANSVGSSSCAGGTIGGLSGFYGEFLGTVGAGSTSASLNFSNETWTTGTWTWATNTDGQPKGLSSKWGVGYNATGSYGGSGTYYKFNDTTLTQLSTITRPESCGEENHCTGQDWGYSLGSYNGANQTNNSQKCYYTTDSVVSTTGPEGHGGASSAATGTGSALLLGGF